MALPQYNASEYKRNRAQLLQGEPICHWCGTRTATQADHLVPIDMGGTNDITNLVAACAPCNTSRGARYRNAKHNPTATTPEPPKILLDRRNEDHEPVS